MTVMLKIILALAGLAIMALGLNIGLGGIATLGWQGPSDFFLVTNAKAFAVQDNHIRFLAGIWFGAGAIFLAGTFALNRFRSILFALIAMIFIGGLARLSSSDPLLLLSSDIFPSLFTELIIFPLIAFWIYRSSGKVYD
ncbi:MAG: DUF4345 domain-containing protein [Parasphingorhabdus sp.]|uniref:DUF4345 domain-containing protein n=1 Tax=Parasphingorhabdus sp. TaxID=2709688 RepID=UPI003296FAA0